jgi:hypothetical protein
MIKYLAKLLLPYIGPLIEEKLHKLIVDTIEEEFGGSVRTLAYRATDAQLATDTLAEHLGYTITVDSETGVASVHGVKP